MKCVSAIIFICLLSFHCRKDLQEERINDMVGPEKWAALKTYLLAHQPMFAAPPSSFIDLRENGQLCRLGGGGSLDNTCPPNRSGTWEIDPKSETFRLDCCLALNDPNIPYMQRTIFRDFRLNISGSDEPDIAVDLVLSEKPEPAFRSAIPEADYNPMSPTARYRAFGPARHK